MENQKSRFLNCISKRIFNCRYGRNDKQSDYTFVSYGAIQDTSNNTTCLDSTGPRAVSSMIHKSGESSSASDFTFNKTDLSKNISIYVSDEQLNGHFLYPGEDTLYSSQSTDPEISRRSSCNSFSSSKTTYDPEVSIASNNSPLSKYQTLHIDTISSSCEYLHSTELSDQANTTGLLPMSPSLLFPRADAPNNSVVSSVSDEGVSNELRLVDSIIKDISYACEGDSTHVVINDYQATFVDDISVTFAERLNIIRDDNDEWVFVEVSNDGRTGFVPRRIVTSIAYFKQQLVDHRSSISGSRTSLISASIDI